VKKLGELFRRFINSQVRISDWFDGLLPAKFSASSHQDFLQLVTKYINNGTIIYDIGGGKNPFITLERKSNLNYRVIGVDIDEDELKAAPVGVYDNTIVADITKYTGDMDGDVVICSTVLEHVESMEAALRGIGSCLKNGGYCAIFVPSKNALYARINRILPERLKRRILFSLFPDSRSLSGFPAYYDHCTPQDVKQIAKSLGLEVLEEKYYYKSKYFSFFFPLYLLWRIYLLVFYFIEKEQAAETFIMVLKKGGPSTRSKE
jgi:SAM-dependent methyltransferase